MKNTAIVYDGSSVYTTEKPLVVPSRSFLIKPIYVFIDGVENYVLSGYTPLARPVVLGHTGVARIIEAGYGAPQEASGAIAVFAPIDTFSSTILSVNADGLLSRYAAPPASTCFSELSNPEPLLSIIYHVATGIRAAAMARGKEFLVVGAGISGISAAIAAASEAIDTRVLAYARKSQLILRRNNISFYKNVKEVKKRFDVVYISTLATPHCADVSRLVRSDGIVVINPLTSILKSICISGISVKVKVSVPERKDLDDAVAISRSVFSEYIRVVKPSSLDDIKTLIPVRSLGVIVDLTGI